MSKKNSLVVLSVTNDLFADQRVNKVARSLIKLGYKPLLIGRRLKSSKNLSPRPYPTKRFKLLFSKGVLFYASYNFRLFLFLLFKKAAVFVANDLDTLPANYFAYRIKKIFSNKDLKLVYDSHELFTEVPELNGRKLAKKTWLFFEKLLLPQIKNAYTVCDSIAQYYYQKYGVKMQIIQNLPICKNNESPFLKSCIEIPENKKVILYQGALNIGRGLEHIIQIMDRIDESVLLIAGTGDIAQYLKKLVAKKGLNEKVIFTGSIPLENLSCITKRANLGLVLQEDISLSYRYVLPNRLFDFIKAKVPILASDLPEIRKIVEKEKIGLLVDDFNPDVLLEKVNKLLNHKDLIRDLKQNMENCASKYCWETQEDKLNLIYQNLK